MYFFYFDESGSRDPRAQRTLSDGTVQALDHLYVLTAVSLFEWRWRRFERDIANLKLELSDYLHRIHKLRFDLADCEVKSTWLRNPQQREKESPFLHALGDKDRQRLVDCYYAQIPAHHMRVFAVVIDKRKLHEHMDHEKLHKKAYELILERIEHFMAEFYPKHQAVIVMDDTDKTINRALAMKHAFFQREGNQVVSFKHIVEYPFFADSRLSNGVQLADLCSYNVYRAFRDQDFKYAFFRRLLPHFYRRGEGEKLDGLKVFPDESELVAFAREGWTEFKTGEPTLWSGLSDGKK